MPYDDTLQYFAWGRNGNGNGIVINCANYKASIVCKKKAKTAVEVS
jgi:hypothetical protein